MMIIKKVTKTISLMKFSLYISMKASKVCTFFRLAQNVTTSLLPIITSHLAREVVNTFSISSNLAKMKLIVLLMSITTISFISMLIEKIGKYILTIHTSTINNYLDVSFSKKASELDLSFFDSAKFYNLLANAKRDSGTIPTFIYQTIQTIGSFISIIASFLILLSFKPILSSLVILTILPNIIVNKHYAKILFSWENNNIDKLRKKSYYYNLLTNRRYAQDIRFFGLSSSFLFQLNELWESWFLEKKKLSRKRIAISILTNVLPILCSGLFLLVLGFSILNGDKLPGDFIFYSSQLQSLQTSLLVISSCIVAIYDNKLRISNLSDFFELKSTIHYVGKRKISTFESIEFENVSFSYPGTSALVLKNISFTVYSMDKIAIVGINGAGKTTLIKLILRFYDPIEGKIKINGIDIKEYDIYELRKLFGVMFQEYNTYAFTIKENICLNDIEKAMASSEETLDDDIKCCLKLSGVESFVSGLPQGTQTYISREYSENGFVMSTGMKQKLSIAGMFYRNCSFVLLDEPSASLDPESEHKLFESIAELSFDKTLLFISHRLSNVNMANKILVIENGEIIESGSHAELMNSRGRYYTLYKYQQERIRKDD